MYTFVNFFRKKWISSVRSFRNVFSLQNRKERLFPSGDNHPSLDPAMHSRRELIKSLATMPLFGFLFWKLARNTPGWKSHEEAGLFARVRGDVTTGESPPENLQGKVPHGKIGDLEISRMMPGGNLVGGFAHSRDLVYVSDLLKEYHTDEKVIETLFLAEECGMNAAILRTDEDTVRILGKYRKQGGNIKWIAQYYPSPDNMDNLNLAIDNGADAAFSQGARADSFVTHNRLYVLHDSLEYARRQGIPSGIGAHLLEVIKASEEEELDPDFYMKTLHHYRYWSAPPEQERDTISASNWSPDTDRTIAYMEKVDKPWIAFKVLAAGSIRPQDGFRFAFESGADFICVGMFDFQVVENSNITWNLFRDEIPRNRAWMG